MLTDVPALEGRLLAARTVGKSNILSMSVDRAAHHVTARRRSHVINSSQPVEDVFVWRKPVVATAMFQASSSRTKRRIYQDEQVHRAGRV